MSKVKVAVKTWILISLMVLASSMCSFAATNVETIDYLEDDSWITANQIQSDIFIKEGANKLRNRTKNDFIGRALEVYKTELAYKVGKSGLYHSDRFIKDESGIKVMKADGSEIDKNAWFMDTDGRWYAFDANGTMIHGVIYDKTRDTYYILNPMKHEYGALVHANGYYIINGGLVHLSFDNTHTGIFGSVASGVYDIE